MYSLIYDYLANYIFSHTYLENTSINMFGGTITLQAWLCHSCCIVLAIVFFVVILLFVRYLFRLFGGLLLNR